MKVLVIVGHQRTGSFCHAIAAAAVEELRRAGHRVTYHDLYAERFDPILPHEEIPPDAPIDPLIRRHCDEVIAADGFVVVHPNWWGQPPAMLKGWLDRVLRQGVAYAFGPGGVVELFGDPLENLWKNCVFGFCGVKHFARTNFESMILSTPEQRRGWLAEVRRLTAEHFPAG
jgi:putative NADPH-quinone reductase